MTRAFLVDGLSLGRVGVSVQLAATPGLLLVGQASQGQELLDQLPLAAADVVLLGAELSVPDSLATTQRLRGEFPQAKVLVLASLGPGHHVSRFLRLAPTAACCLLPQGQSCNWPCGRWRRAGSF